MGLGFEAHEGAVPTSGQFEEPPHSVDVVAGLAPRRALRRRVGDRTALQTAEPIAIGRRSLALRGALFFLAESLRSDGSTCVRICRVARMWLNHSS